MSDKIERNEIRYADPILAILADLKVVYENANNEIVRLRQLLNEQNESMMAMQKEIESLRTHNGQLG